MIMSRTGERVRQVNAMTMTGLEGLVEIDWKEVLWEVRELSVYEVAFLFASQMISAKRPLAPRANNW